MALQTLELNQNHQKYQSGQANKSFEYRRKNADAFRASQLHVRCREVSAVVMNREITVRFRNDEWLPDR